MARTFDGVDDTIRLAGASLTGIDLGGRTAIMLLKRGSNGAYAALFVAWQDAGVTDAWAMEIDTANQLEFYQVVGGSPVNSGALTVTVSDGWTLVGMNKTTGSTTPRFHKYVMSTGTATHANASGVQGNTRQIGASGYLEIGTYGPGVDPMNGEIAFAAILDHQVTDAEFEGLATSLQSWLTSGAIALWAFDQAATSTLVRDMVGTAHQTAIVGTAAGTTSPPMGYGHQIIIPTGVAAGGGGTAFTQTNTGGITPTSTLAKAAALTRTGANTPAGTIRKATAQTRTGTLTPAGALIKAVAKTVAGTLTPTGAISQLRTKLQTLTGSITPTGVIVKAIAVARTGSITPTGTNRKAVSITRTGSTTPTGALSQIRAYLQTLVGSITPTSTLRKATSKTAAGTITPTGTTSKAVAQTRTGTITPTGRIIKAIGKTVAGTIVSAGTIRKAITKLVGGIISAAGALDLEGGGEATPDVPGLARLTITSDTGQMAIGAARATLTIANADAAMTIN